MIDNEVRSSLQLLVCYTDKELPKIARQTSMSSGLDLYSTKTVTLEPNMRELISCGIKLVIPLDYEVQIRPRSGLALKHGVTVLNSPGTVDNDYRGDIGVILTNHGSEPYTINRGDRIAQMVLCPVSYMSPISITEEAFSTFTTERLDGGYGHTGK